LRVDRVVVRRDARHSDSRFAQAGNGNSTASGTGSLAGRQISHRVCERGTGSLEGGNPYSGRPASAESRRPTTRMAEFETVRRSTSLAVCCAPIKMIPRERPRSAISSSTSLIGEVPSRGAYLIQGSSSPLTAETPAPARVRLRTRAALLRLVGRKLSGHPGGTDQSPLTGPEVPAPQCPGQGSLQPTLMPT
jgi:hypothetical protein